MPPPLPDGTTSEPVYVQYAFCVSRPGLGRDAEKRLFHRFEQATLQMHAVYGGSGLGLFVSRELAETREGQVGGLSEKGRAGTFEFSFKAWRCEGLAARPTTCARASVGQIDDPSGSKDGHGARWRNLRQPAHARLRLAGATAEESPEAGRVLAVEDSLIDQKVTATQLQRRGCVVAVANRGGEALDFAHTTARFVAPGSLQTTSADGSTGGNRAASPEPLKVLSEVVLLDWEMLVMDGLECVRRIRARQQERKLRDHVPASGVTANARDPQRATAIQQGMVRHSRSIRL